MLIGVNLLREGLDLPEVSLVAILDADKEGFLRSAGALIQTIGRAARHVRGRSILYADRITKSMKQAMDETDRRREIQRAYNLEHGITPQSIAKPIDMSLARIVEADYITPPKDDEASAGVPESPAQLLEMVEQLEKKMREAAKAFEFEKAAELRDRIKTLKTRDLTGMAEIKAS